MEGLDEVTKTVGWQSKSYYYLIDLNKFDQYNEKITPDNLIKVEYPKNQGTRYGSVSDYPVNTIVTEWHVIFLFQFSICIISKITNEIVFNSKIGGESEMLGLCVDNLLSTVWMHSNKKMYTLDYSQEKSNIWIAYFKKGRYKDALELCRDPKSSCVISGCVGDQYFSGGSYDLSVDYYIKSNKTFEEVSLKFLSKNLHSHLCKYLEKFLDKIKKQELLWAQRSGRQGSDTTGHTERYRPQKILLSTWIVELKLNEINDVKARFELESVDHYDKDSYDQSIEHLEKYLWQFLDENFADKNEIEHILQNHGRINENAKSPKDFINRKMYRQALDCVKQIGTSEQRFSMMKKYCLIFLQKDLKYTLETLRSSKFNKMDFSELVPSFADVSANHEDKIPLMLDFLKEHCIERLKRQDKIIHNLAFYFMTRLLDLEPMINYLQFLES